MSFKHTHLINEQHNTKKWKRFYLLEQEFYSFLDQNGTILKSEVNCLPQYKTIATAGGKFVQAPPIYVRAVISIANSTVKDAVKYSEDLKVAYREALTEVEKEFKSYPSRFPVIAPDLYQINIWRQNATSSKVLKKNTSAKLCRFFTDSESREQANQVANHLTEMYNIQASVIKSSIQLKNQEREAAIYVTAPVEELLQHFNVENIRLRRESGTQFRAKCFSSKEDNSPLRLNYGLIITTGNPDIYETVPQPTRSHKTQRIKSELTFSGKLNGQFVDLYEEQSND